MKSCPTILEQKEVVKKKNKNKLKSFFLPSKQQHVDIINQENHNKQKWEKRKMKIKTVDWRSTLDPCSRRILTISPKPLQAAQWRAVQPYFNKKKLLKKNKIKRPLSHNHQNQHIDNQKESTPPQQIKMKIKKQKEIEERERERRETKRGERKKKGKREKSVFEKPCLWTWNWYQVWIVCFFLQVEELWQVLYLLSQQQQRDSLFLFLNILLPSFFFLLLLSFQNTKKNPKNWDNFNFFLNHLLQDQGFFFLYFSRSFLFLFIKSKTFNQKTSKFWRSECSQLLSNPCQQKFSPFLQILVFCNNSKRIIATNFAKREHYKNIIIFFKYQTQKEETHKKTSQSKNNNLSHSKIAFFLNMQKRTASTTRLMRGGVESERVGGGDATKIREKIRENFVCKKQNCNPFVFRLHPRVSFAPPRVFVCIPHVSFAPSGSSGRGVESFCLHPK